MEEKKTPRLRTPKKAPYRPKKLPKGDAPEVPGATAEPEEETPKNVSDFIVEHLVNTRWPISF